jgi:hypothetical protein
LAHLASEGAGSRREFGSMHGCWRPSGVWKCHPHHPARRATRPWPCVCQRPRRFSASVSDRRHGFACNAGWKKQSEEPPQVRDPALLSWNLWPGPEGMLVTAVQSCSGETFQLNNAVIGTYLPAHEWLAHLEVALRGSLRECTYEAMQQIANMPEDEWHVTYPQQSIYLATALAFTRAAEGALLADAAEGHRRGSIRSLAEQMNVRLETITQRLAAKPAPHGPGSTSRLRALAVLVLATITHRDAATRLHQEGAQSAADWLWISMIRYSWPAHDLLLSVGDAQMNYGWEYNGTGPRGMDHLVVHSEQAATTACMAIYHDGIVAVPAATPAMGVQMPPLAEAIANTFGRPYVSLICTTCTTSRQLQRLLQGALAMNAWCGLHDMHQLAPTTLSALSMYAESILKAISANSQLVMLGNVEAPIGMTPALAGRESVPFALICMSCTPDLCSKHHIPAARNVIFTPPDLAILLEAAFRYAPRTIAGCGSSHKITYLLIQLQLCQATNAIYRLRGLRLATQAAKATSTVLAYFVRQLPLAMGNYRHDLATFFIWKHLKTMKALPTLATVAAHQVLSMLINQMAEHFRPVAAGIVFDVFGDPVADLLAAPGSKRGAHDCNMSMYVKRASELDIRCLRSKVCSRVRRPEPLTNSDNTRFCKVSKTGHAFVGVQELMNHCHRLEQSLLHSRLVLLTGHPEVGKTTCWRIVRAKLQSQHQVQSQGMEPHSPALHHVCSPYTLYLLVCRCTSTAMNCVESVSPEIGGCTSCSCLVRHVLSLCSGFLPSKWNGTACVNAGSRSKGRQMLH